jgi:hypothetical protein
VNTILLIIIFLVLGVIFGFILAKLSYSISSYFLKRNIEKDAKANPQPFFYKLKPYDLKKEIEYEQSKKKKGFFSKIFKRKQKGGISNYGNTEQPRIVGTTFEKPILTDNGSSSEPVPIPDNPTPTAPTSREQRSPDSPQTRGFGVNVNGNLFKKGK